MFYTIHEIGSKVDSKSTHFPTRHQQINEFAWSRDPLELKIFWQPKPDCTEGICTVLRSGYTPENYRPDWRIQHAAESFAMGENADGSGCLDAMERFLIWPYVGRLMRRDTIAGEPPLKPYFQAAMEIRGNEIQRDYVEAALLGEESFAVIAKGTGGHPVDILIYAACLFDIDPIRDDREAVREHVLRPTLQAGNVRSCIQCVLAWRFGAQAIKWWFSFAKAPPEADEFQRKLMLEVGYIVACTRAGFRREAMLGQVLDRMLDIEIEPQEAVRMDDHANAAAEEGHEVQSGMAG